MSPDWSGRRPTHKSSAEGVNVIDVRKCTRSLVVMVVMDDRGHWPVDSVQHADVTLLYLAFSLRQTQIAGESLRYI